MNITLAVDEKTAEKARAAARAMGKSLNQVIREHLESLAGAERLEAEIKELRQFAGAGDSKGKPFDRNELYEERLNRAAPSSSQR